MALEVLSVVLTLFGFLGTPPQSGSGPGGATSEREALERLEAEAFGEPATSGDAVGAHTVEMVPRSFLDRPEPTLSSAHALGPDDLRGVRLPGFTVPVVMNAPVKAYLDFFQGRGKSILAHWLKRMGRHQARLEALLAKEGAPPELVYVAMIESGFDPTAVSGAAAVGPWQLMPRTATQLGLRRDGFIDERRSWEKSTQIAARYLLDLEKQFGSWPLALAAYNCGPGVVEEAVSRTHETDFWALAAAGALPEGTSRYVPKIMAAMILGSDPARHGFDQIVPDKPDELSQVHLPGGQDLRALARSLELDSETLCDLNPELRRGYTPPGAVDWPLWIPTRALDRFNEQIDVRNIEGKVFAEYAVRFGERLRDIAQAYGVTQSALRRLNELPVGEPRPGQIVLVPATPLPPPANAPPPPLLVRTDPDITVEVNGRKEVFLPVSERMEVGEIAAFFGISPGDVGLWNALDPQAPLRSGQVLRLFVAPDFDLSRALVVPPERVTTVAAHSEAAANALAHAGVDRLPGVKRVAHTVARGETLWRIAKAYHVSLQALRAENGLGPHDGASPGRVLQVPTLDAPSPPRAAHPKTYTVTAGDTLSRIARHLKVNERRLQRKNNLDDNPRLRPGQLLQLP